MILDLPVLVPYIENGEWNAHKVVLSQGATGLFGPKPNGSPGWLTLSRDGRIMEIIDPMMRYVVKR